MITNEVDSPDTLDPFIESKNEAKKLATTGQTPSLLFSKRFLIIVLLFVSNIIWAILEHNGSLAVIEMTSNKTAPNGSLIEPAQFQWDTKTIGLVLSIFSYGKLLSFSSGWLIDRLGASTSWNLSTIVCGLATTVHPICLRYDFYLFLVCRFIAGIFHGFAFSGSTEVLSNWAPKNERGTLVSIFYNAMYIGLAIVHPVCGFIAAEWGWAMVFYSTGITSSLFAVLCLIIIRNRPSEDKWISKAERSYILRETDVNTSKKVVTQPYRKILASKPVWALFLLNWINTSMASVLTTSMSLFIKDSTKKGTKDVALISAVPGIVVIFVSFFIGTLLDFWKNRSTISQTKMHKILVAGAFTSQMGLLLGLTMTRDLIVVVLLFVLIRLTATLVTIIKQMVLFGLAPNHSGLLTGFIMAWCSLGTITTQTVTGFMTTNHTLEEWNRCFYLTAGLLFFGAVIFTLYGSSKPQSWSISSNFENQSDSVQKKNSDSTRLSLVQDKHPD